MSLPGRDWAVKSDWNPDDKTNVGSFASKRIHELLARIEQATAQGDAQATAEAAHALRSSAMNLRAERLATLAGELERLGESGKLGRCEPLLESIRREARAVEEELKQKPDAA